MEDFSIELAAERINDSRTRDYFREVLSSFINGSYRSSTVMLWSIVVADLVYKLHDLQDLYNDPTAKSILISMNAKQKQNPNSPDWELELVDELNTRTHFFEPADYQNLLQLQKLRHLSAHPVLSGTNVLFSPNKETARAVIRNAMEGVLLKPPIFSKKIVSAFVNDLAAKKSLLPDDESLIQYLDAKYLNSLHTEVGHELFKALWKFCFRLEDSDTNNNREINVRALNILFSRKPAEFKGFVQANQSFFSELKEGPPLVALIHFLSKHHSIYEALSGAARILIEECAKSDVDLFVISSFLSESIDAHIEALVALPDSSSIGAGSFDQLVTAARAAGCVGFVCRLGAQIYGASPDFNSADHNFRTYIGPYLADFDAESLSVLLTTIESNNQTYNRGRAWSDHPKVKDRCKGVFGEEFDPDQYPNFKRNTKDAD